jgi:hypothetical protein
VRCEVGHSESMALNDTQTAYKGHSMALNGKHLCTCALHEGGVKSDTATRASCPSSNSSRSMQLVRAASTCGESRGHRGEHLHAVGACREHLHARAVIRGHQRSYEVIRGHQRSSEVIRSHQRSSEIIRSHQRGAPARARR